MDLQKAVKPKATHRLRTYDFLRGLAVLAVITVHTSLAFPTAIVAVDSILAYGRLGVQLFYFISALTMCYMWDQRVGERRPVRNFYLRRFLRIAPLFWLAIPTYLFLYGTTPNYWAPEGIGTSQIALTATFLHGFWPDAINSVVPGGWSIAVEMTFYLIFPALILIIGKRKNLYLVCGFLVWLIYILYIREWIGQFLATHYITSSVTIVEDFLNLNFFNQAPIFLLGCFIYFSQHKYPSFFSVIILLLWISIGAYLKLALSMHGMGFLIQYLLMSMAVTAAIRIKFKNKAIENLGKNSYSIYLSHFAVISLIAYFAPVKNGILAFCLAWVLTTILSYILSIALYQLIEKPIHRFAEHTTISS